MKLTNTLKTIGVASLGFLPLQANANETEGFVFGSATLPSSGIPGHYRTGYGIGVGMSIPLRDEYADNNNFYLRFAGEYNKFKGDETIIEERKLFRTERTEYPDYVNSYAAEAGLTYAPTKKAYLSGGYGIGQVSEVSGIERTGSRDNITLKTSSGRTGHGPYGLIGVRARNFYLEFGAKKLKFKEGEDFSGLFARLGITFGTK